MGRVVLAVLCGTLLFALLWSVCSADELAREGRTEPAATSSYFKSWGDWAQGKLGYYGKKQEEPPLQHQTSTGGWSDWAYQKISSFSGRTSKEAEKAKQAGKEKVKDEGRAVSKEGQDLWEGAKGGAREGSETAKDYAGKAKEGAKEGSETAKDHAGKTKEGMSEKVKEYAGKAKEGVSHQADKAYEASKNLGSQATQRLKEDAEL